MKLQPLSPEQVRQVYATQMVEAFPPAELKSLDSILTMMSQGIYYPLGLMDGDEIAGACLLWEGHPGWLLLDYLCVDEHRRNAGLGAVMLAQLTALYPQAVVIAESEYPPFAPDIPLAERRLEFYRRNHARTANFRGTLFGVCYTIFYWATNPVEDDVLMAEYRHVYQQSFTPEKFEKYVVIPDKSENPREKTPWEQ